jgi:hypothetical protein
MKHFTLAVVLLVLGASAAFADGSGGSPPDRRVSPPVPSVVQLADGSGLPPAAPAKPLQPNVTV